MGHYATADKSESYCAETGEFDVYVDGRTVTSGPQPDSYCSACGEVEPKWEPPLSDEEFLKLWPLE